MRNRITNPLISFKGAEMKIAVINFSGNVGKTTVSRHLLLPRIGGAELVAVESLNADEGQGQALRGRQFGELQEYLQTVDAAVVDIGASNVEDLLGMMHRYRGSHEDFDCFIVPTVSALKQQQDTIATLAELARLGVSPSRLKLVFNMSRTASKWRRCLTPCSPSSPNTRSHRRIRHAAWATNEIYERVKGNGADLATLARDETDYKALIVEAASMADKLALAQKLAARRLASGVVPELDACFAALGLGTDSARNVFPLSRRDT